MIRIIVSTEQEKQELLAASRIIHDYRFSDSDIPGMNTLMHLHLAPQLIEVEEKTT